MVSAAPGDLEGDAVQRLDLRAAVAELDDWGRELIALRFGADLTARQIGELTGRKTHAVEMALQRTLTRLREQLEGADRPAGARSEISGESCGPPGRSRRRSSSPPSNSGSRTIADTFGRACPAYASGSRRRRRCC